MAENGNIRILPAVMRYTAALLAGMAAAVICIAAFSALLASTALPDAFADVLVCVSTAVGALVCGFVLAMNRTGKGIVSGVIAGAAHFVLLFCVGAICFRDQSFGLMTLALLTVSIFAGAFGGIFAANVKKH